MGNTWKDHSAYKVYVEGKYLDGILALQITAM